MLLGALGIFGLFCFLSLAHCVYKLYKSPEWLYEFTINQISYGKRQYLYLATSIIGLLVLVYSGTKSLLYIIPLSWGQIDEYGEFIPLVEIISSLAAFGSIALIDIVRRYLLLSNERKTK